MGDVPATSKIKNGKGFSRLARACLRSIRRNATMRVLRTLDWLESKATLSGFFPISSQFRTSCLRVSSYGLKVGVPTPGADVRGWRPLARNERHSSFTVTAPRPSLPEGWLGRHDILPSSRKRKARRHQNRSDGTWSTGDHPPRPSPTSACIIKPPSVPVRTSLWTI